MSDLYNELLAIPNIKQFYLDRVHIAGDNECWLSKLKVNMYGYGKTHVYLDGKHRTMSLHRLAYFIFNGDIDDGLVIRHTCHNRACSNPRHLILGTYQENSDDKVAAGRAYTKLTEPDVLIIIQRIKDGEEYSVIARSYGVNESTIGDIRRGRTWKHLTGGPMEIPARKFARNEVAAYEQGYRVDRGGILFDESGDKAHVWIDNRGYYVFRIFPPEHLNGRTIQIHRLQAYQLFGEDLYGPGILVRHINNNPLDNSADNLRLGTKSENRFDMSPKERSEYSKKANKSKRKLNDEQLREFWHDRLFNGYGCLRLAEKYGISMTCAGDITKGKNYRDESEAIKQQLLAEKDKQLNTFKSSLIKPK